MTREFPMRHLTTTSLLAFATGLAAAHDGHGVSGAHWHASDLFGPLVLAVAVAALWFWRRK